MEYCQNGKFLVCFDSSNQKTLEEAKKAFDNFLQARGIHADSLSLRNAFVGKEEENKGWKK
jgi:hypothetical protein